VPAFSTPEIVAPFAGDLYQTPSAPLNGAGVGVVLVGVGVGLGVGEGVGLGVAVTVPLLLTVTLMSASVLLPRLSYAMARSVYEPSLNEVVGKVQLNGAL
jgi:hypothetical protein